MLPNASVTSLLSTNAKHLPSNARRQFYFSQFLNSLQYRLRHRLCLNRWQRIARDLGLKATQALINRNQFDDRAPGVDEILERSSDLPECPDDLVHCAERDLAGND